MFLFVQKTYTCFFMTFAIDFPKALLSKFMVFKQMNPQMVLVSLHKQTE